MWAKNSYYRSQRLGGTCVNRGCIPSKALLAASGRVRELADSDHLKSLGIAIAGVNFDRPTIADHANNLVSKIRGDLTNSLKRLKVDTIHGWGKIAGPQKVSVIGDSGEKIYTAKDIMLCPGRFPLSHRGSRSIIKRFLPAMRPLD